MNQEKKEGVIDGLLKYNFYPYYVERDDDRIRNELINSPSEEDKNKRQSGFNLEQAIEFGIAGTAVAVSAWMKDAAPMYCYAGIKAGTYASSLVVHTTTRAINTVRGIAFGIYIKIAEEIEDTWR